MLMVSDLLQSHSPTPNSTEQLENASRGRRLRLRHWICTGNANTTGGRRCPFVTMMHMHILGISIAVTSASGIANKQEFTGAGLKRKQTHAMEMAGSGGLEGHARMAPHIMGATLS